MTTLNRGMLLLALSCCSVSRWSHSVKVTIENISEPGELHVAIYDSKGAFEQNHGEKDGPAPGIVDGLVVAVESSSFSHLFELPAGVYAAGVFHDLNANNRLDTNLFGVPKEQFGFSNNVVARSGPPSFEAASIQISSTASFSIQLRQHAMDGKRL